MKIALPGLMRLLLLSVIPFGRYPIFLSLGAVGRSVTGTTEPGKNRTEGHQRDGECPPIARARTSWKRHELVPASFPALFSKGVETTSHEVTGYHSTFDLVNKLVETDDSLRTKPGTRAP